MIKRLKLYLKSSSRSIVKTNVRFGRVLGKYSFKLAYLMFNNRYKCFYSLKIVILRLVTLLTRVIRS